MKRLLCIVGSMNAGGAETFLMKIYRELDKSKYQMDFVVATDEKGFYDDEITSLGGKIYHIIPKSRSVVKNFFAIKNLVSAESYTHVLRTSQHSLSALELLAAMLGGAKVRVFRSSNSNTTTASKKQFFLHKLCMFMPRLFANIKIAPSTEAAEFMFGKYYVAQGKAVILKNAIDHSMYQFNMNERRRFRDSLNLKDKLIIGHIGRFNIQKNHTFLLEIFAEIYKINHNAVLCLCGIGPLEDSMRLKVQALGIQNTVKFLGLRADVGNILSGFDVFLFPSLYEGMPNTVLEAQASGLPCIISDTITKECDITGLVEFKSLQHTPKQWAKTILRIYEEKKRINTEQIFIDKGYDIKSATQKFVRLLFN